MGLVGQNYHLELCSESYWELVQILDDWSCVLLMSDPFQKAGHHFLDQLQALDSFQRQVHVEHKTVV